MSFLSPLKVNSLVFVLALAFAGGVQAKEPKYKFRPPPPADATAPYCEEGKIGHPNGKIVALGSRVFHTCANHASTAVHTILNPKRVPGLRYALSARTTGAETNSSLIEGLSAYQTVLSRNLESYPDFRDRVILGGGVYSVHHAADRLVLAKNGSGAKVHPGNLYIYEGPAEGSSERPPHHVYCLNEPLNIAENDDYSCKVRIAWHDMTVRVRVWAGGKLFSPMEHEHFPALVDDMLLLLETVDVTDDPKRQECIRAGNGWWDGECRDGS